MSKRVAAVLFSYYPSDPRPRREAEALVEAGYAVDMICLRNKNEASRELINGVHVYRMPLSHKRIGKLRYIWEYSSFFVMSFLVLSFFALFRRYSLVHIHNMPDFLAFCAVLPRLMDAKIILDLHDPMPEVYMTKFSLPSSHPAIRFLSFLENKAIRFSDLVVTPNIAFREVFISRGCPESKIKIIMNSPDEKIFSLSPNSNRNIAQNNHFRLMYHGTIMEQNGLGVALKAVAVVRKKIPDISFHVYGDGEYLDRARMLCSRLGIDEYVHFHGRVPLEKIPEEISSMDIGLIPNQPSVHWSNAFPTRLFEYLCMKKPVIVPRTKGILDYFDEQAVFFHNPGDAESLADTICKVYKDAPSRSRVLNQGITVYKKYCWDKQRRNFLDSVGKLLGF